MIRNALLRRLHLAVVLGLTIGVLLAVPVNCICEDDEHSGQIVHSILRHHHGDHQHASVDGQAFGDDRAVVTSGIGNGGLPGLALEGLALPLIALAFRFWRSNGAPLVAGFTTRPAEYIGVPPTYPPRFAFDPSA